MPSIADRILRRAGYAPEAQVHEVSRSLAEARQQIAKLKQQLDETREEARAHKEKSRERSERLQERLALVERKHQEHFARTDQKVQREVQRLKTHDVRRGATLDDIRERMSWADKSNRLGREHLMAIEVKLDIIEGAITVLDRRTRNELSRKP